MPYKKMDPKVKKLWVAALRSGKYAQCRKTLRRGTTATASFCCLGVLYDIHAKKISRKNPKWKGSLFFFNREENSGSLAEKFRERVGLTKKSHDRLVRMNDSEFKSFSQIADFITKNL